MSHRHACSERKPWQLPNYNNKSCNYENNWVLKIARVTRADLHEKNGGVKGRDRSAEELDRETGEKTTTVGRTLWKDDG